MITTLIMDKNRPDILAKIFFDDKTCSDPKLSVMLGEKLKKFIMPFYSPPLLWKGLREELSETHNSCHLILEIECTPTVFNEIKVALTENTSNIEVELIFRPEAKKELPDNLSLSVVDNSFDFEQEICLTQDLQLTFYSGKKISYEKIQVVCFHNYTDKPKRIFLAGTSIFRTVPAKNYICALRTNGQFISFLPRANLIDETVLMVSDGKLSAFADGESTLLSETNFPVCWAYRNNYGTFVTNLDGQLDKRVCIIPQNNFQQITQKKIVKLVAYGAMWCMLFEDGTSLSSPVNPSWQDIIDVRLGEKNSAIALNRARQIISRNGKIIANENIVDFYGHDNHFILLTPTGTVKTDTGIKIDNNNRAVAITAKGFLVANKNGLSLYNFQNKLCRTWEEIDAEELIASDNYAIWFSAKDGTTCAPRTIKI